MALPSRKPPKLGPRVAIVLAASVAFVLGILAARACGAPAPPGHDAGGRASADVDVMVDPGRVVLLPDASLRLEPWVFEDAALPEITLPDRDPTEAGPARPAGSSSSGSPR